MENITFATSLTICSAVNTSAQPVCKLRSLRGYRMAVLALSYTIASIVTKRVDLRWLAFTVNASSMTNKTQFRTSEKIL